MCSQVTWHSGGGLLTKSCLTLMTPWTVACQATLSMGFSRQEYWSGLPFPSPSHGIWRQNWGFCLLIMPPGDHALIQSQRIPQRAWPRFPANVC